MNEAVVDSSVLLAILGREPHADDFLPDSGRVVISTVSLTEIISRLITKGSDPTEAWLDARRVLDEVVAFDEQQARLAAGMIEKTRKLGLSLGDRACLALARVRGLPVYTADRAWRGVDVGIEIHVVR